MRLSEALTICIAAFERNDALARCVASIREITKTIPVIVVNDGRLPPVLHLTNGRLINMKFDSGLSAKRNMMLKVVRSKYMMLLDDDFFFRRQFPFGEMVDVLERHDDIDILGGRIEGRTTNWNTTVLRINGTEIDRRSGAHRKGGGITYCDMIPNFWVGDVAKIRKMGGWDADLKCGGEHLDFFAKAKKAGIGVAQMDTPFIGHRHTNSKFYDKQLSRRVGYIDMMMRKGGYTRVKHNGRVIYEIDSDNVFHRREGSAAAQRRRSRKQALQA